MIGKNLNLKFGLNTIYEDANFIIPDNSKVGIVGLNGCGKTTLFKVLLKEIELDSGSITFDGMIGYLPQTIEINDNITVLDYLLNARPISKIKNEISNLYEEISLNDKDSNKKLKKIGKLESLLDYYDQYNAENTLFDIILNMQIDDKLLESKMHNLSGGQKSKVAFAALLYSKANILLLDEPTNHLDVETKNYVTNFLKNYEGTILIISHDIDFLNEIVDHIMHIDKTTKKIEIYKGNYNDYLKKSEEALKNTEKLIKNQEREIKKLKDFVLLYSNSSGKRKRIAESREKLLAKKEKEMIDPPKTAKHVNMHLTPVNEGSKIPLQVECLTFGYSKNLFENLSFTINNKERFLILGENGVGKSTLLKLIMDYLKPRNGIIKFGSKTKIAYYAQEQENLDLEKTILENMASPLYKEREIYQALGDFLFTNLEFNHKVKYLSPGERARINLAKIILTKANLLLLDEPTNHLDPITQTLIAKNFKEYDGTIILVSHNKNFIENVGINRILLLPSGKIINYKEEVLDDYCKKQG